MLILKSVIGVVFATEVTFLSLKEQLQNIKIVLKVKVLKIEHGYTAMKLKDGSDGPKTSTFITVNGKITDVVWGATNIKDIVIKYIWNIPIFYDENGKIIGTISPILDGSGLEGSIKAGKEYLFSFSNLNEDGDLQYNLRTDNTSREDEIVKILNTLKGDHK